MSIKKYLVDYKELMKEWNWSKNKDLDPKTITYGSHKKVWWICKKGHEWNCEVKARIKGSKCPICSGRVVDTGVNDLKTLYPQIAKEWDYVKNKDIVPEMFKAQSNKKVWWICEKGHEWEATINSRISGIGCPFCSKELKTSFPEQAIYYYLKKYFKDAINGYKDSKKLITEIDIYLPSKKIGIEYDGRFFHQNNERDKKKDFILESNNIKLIRIKELSKKDKRKEFYVKDNCIYYLPEKPLNLNIVIKYIIEQIIKKEVTEEEINVDRDKIKIWNQYIQKEKNNSFANKFPIQSKEWHPTRNGKLLPNMVSASSGKKVWWKCSKCGYEWETRVANRANGNDCPKCSRNKISKKLNKLIIGKNDLKTLYPEIAQEWNYDKNNDLLPDKVYYNSTKKVWWKCLKCGHEWITSITNRTRLSTGCPKCMYLKNDNILFYKFPKLMKEWNWSKNKDLDPKTITYGSHKKVWWICEKGHEWEARIAHRTNGSKCPYCRKEQIK